MLDTFASLPSWIAAIAKGVSVMTNLACTICTHVMDGKDHPDVCPYCGTPAEQFVPTEDKVTLVAPKAG